MKIFAEKEAEDFLKKYIPVARSVIMSKNTKFWKPPFVLKIVSKKAFHKSDIGGVKIVRKESEMHDNYSSLAKIACQRKLEPYKIIMQEYVEGVEMIIGLKDDPVFGRVLMLGTGGTLVELIKDVSFRVCPINEKDAEDMIAELKLRQLLYGFRGAPLADVKSLKSAMMKVSRLPGKIKEMDINPMIVGKSGAKVADARIVFV